jgi:hypothetical protein
MTLFVTGEIRGEKFDLFSALNLILLWIICKANHSINSLEFSLPQIPFGLKDLPNTNPRSNL